MGRVVEYTLASVRDERPPSPRHRPPLAVRALAGLLGAGVLLVNGVLLLSDRVPGALQRVFGDSARRLWDQIDAGGRTGLPAERIPGSDFYVHVAIWATATALVGLALWTWRGLAIGATGVLACSIVLELAQGRYSISRSVERNDLIGNATGVSLGVLGVTACYLLWSVGARLFGQPPGRAERHDRVR